MPYRRVHDKGVALVQNPLTKNIKISVSEFDLYPTLLNVKELRTELVVVDARDSFFLWFVNAKLNWEIRVSNVIQIAYDRSFGKEVHKFK